MGKETNKQEGGRDRDRRHGNAFPARTPAFHVGRKWEKEGLVGFPSVGKNIYWPAYAIFSLLLKRNRLYTR